MKHLLFAFGLLFFTGPAFAQPDSEIVRSVLEKEPACSNFVRFDDENLYLGFGASRAIKVVPLSAPETAFVLSSADFAVDALRVDSRLYVLTSSALEEWDLAAKTKVATYETYIMPNQMAAMEHPRAFARFEDKLVIAHGRLGVSIFSLKTKHVANQFRLIPSQRPLESMATGIAIVGETAYVVMDNYSLVKPKAPFRGIVTVDLRSERVTSELDGMDPGAMAMVTDGKKLLVNLADAIIWKYGIEDLRGGSQIPEPERRVWKFPVKGHPVGIPQADEKYIYTCFLKKAEPGTNPSSTLVPMALDRHLLMLD